MNETRGGLIKNYLLQCPTTYKTKTMFGIVLLLSIFCMSAFHVLVFRSTAKKSVFRFEEADLEMPTNEERGLVLRDINDHQSGRRTKKNARVDKGVNVNTTADDYFSMHVTEEHIEDLTVELPPTMPNFRNPCWVERVPGSFSYMSDTLYYQYYSLYPEHQPPGDWQHQYQRMESLLRARKDAHEDGRGWRLRCFPYFFLVGFTKAGTSDLRRTLSKLPDFVPGLIKEPKFWNKLRLEIHLGADVLPKPTLSDYLDLYDVAAEDLRHYVTSSPDGSTYHPGIIGDFDPQTIWLLPTWQTIRGNEKRNEPRYTSAHHLYALRPQTKLIVLMRDPVERAFSHYRFFKARKTGSKVIHADKFHEDMEKAIKKLKNCYQEKSIKACVYFPWKYDPSSMRSITVSMYDIYVEDWLNVFPREQFLFLRSEDYFTDRIAVIRHILRFLDIDTPMPKSLVKKMESLPAMNPSAKSGMDNATRTMLQAFFKPTNQKLAEILEDDKWLWNY